MAKYVNFNGSGLKMPNVGGDSNSFMSKIKTAGGSLNMTTIVIISALVLFAVLAGVYCYYTFKPSTAYKPNNEHIETGAASTGKSAELLFFHVDWCPHCKTAKPAWDEIKTQYENKTINGYKVVFTEINCTNETAEVEQMMNKYSIEGFPTIKLLKDGQIIEYDAKPTKATLDQFLTTVL
jgi:thiol-disulfide isomerase/thioredoxin